MRFVCRDWHRPGQSPQPLLARSADRDAELLRRAQLGSAHVAVDRERRAEPGVAGRAAGAQLASALWALARKLVLEFLEVALDKPAAEADGDPVAEGFPALLAQPVGSLAHDTDSSPGRARNRSFSRERGLVQPLEFVGDGDP